jgi:hypothetical protein
LPNFAATIRRIARAVRVTKNYAVCRSRAFKTNAETKGSKREGRKKPRDNQYKSSQIYIDNALSKLP